MEESRPTMSMLKSKEYLAVDKLHAGGCSCCNSKQDRRTAKKAVKRKEERTWRKSLSKEY